MVRFVVAGNRFFFTLYLKFPQVRFFLVMPSKWCRASMTIIWTKGIRRIFQSLATALSGTVVPAILPALAVHLGGPAALFWMFVSAFLG